jgi:hypothetical protein
MTAALGPLAAACCVRSVGTTRLPVRGSELADPAAFGATPLVLRARVSASHHAPDGHLLGRQRRLDDRA